MRVKLLVQQGIHTPSPVTADDIASDWLEAGEGDEAPRQAAGHHAGDPSPVATVPLVVEGCGYPRWDFASMSTEELVDWLRVYAAAHAAWSAGEKSLGKMAPVHRMDTDE